MQDDKLGVIECGFRSKKMINFLNTIMGLQFGREKCEKMRIGKKQHNLDICSDLKLIYGRIRYVMKQETGKNCLVDVHIEKEKILNVSLKKCPGQIGQSDGRNEINIKSHTDKAFGNVIEIKKMHLIKDHMENTQSKQPFF